MAKPTDIATACDRITDVLIDEFPQLSPSDCHFVLSAVAFAYMNSFDRMSDRIKRQPGERG